MLTRVSAIATLLGGLFFLVPGVVHAGVNPSTGDVQAVVIPVGWNGQAGADNAAIASTMQQTAAWYGLSSNGWISLLWHTAAPIALGAPPANYCDKGYTGVAAAIEKQEAKANPISPHQIRIYSLPSFPCPDWAGRGGPEYTTSHVAYGHVWIDGASGFIPSVVIHEIGHTLGLDHAQATPSSVYLPGDPQVVEYGSPFNVMGFGTASADAPGDFGAYEKFRLGWTTPFIPGVFGTYTLAAWELPPAAGTSSSMEIPTADGAYWFEYRTKTGIDAAIDDLYDHALVVSRTGAAPSADFAAKTLLLARDTPLRNPGDVFSDPGIFDVTLQSSNAAGVQLFFRWIDMTIPRIPKPLNLLVAGHLRLAWGPVIETGSGLDKVFVVFDGRQFVLPVTAHSWLSSLRLAPGKHTWKIFAYDRAGNSSSWSGWLQIPRR